LLEIFWKRGGSGFAIQIADKPPRNPQFWRQGPFDPSDPQKGQFDPDDPDRMFVGWNFDSFDPDVREPEPRFRKPMFWRDQVLQFWPQRAATARDETKAIEILTSRLKANENLTFANALDMCREEIPGLSERGFRERVWRKARLAADLPEEGRSGRRATKLPQGPLQKPLR